MTTQFSYKISDENKNRTTVIHLYVIVTAGTHNCDICRCIKELKTVFCRILDSISMKVHVYLIPCYKNRHTTTNKTNRYIVKWLSQWSSTQFKRSIKVCLLSIEPNILLQEKTSIKTQGTSTCPIVLKVFSGVFWRVVL